MLRRKPVPKSKAAALKQGLTPLTSFFKPLREYQESLNNIQPTVQDQQSSSENVSESSTVDLLCETKICKRNAENDFDDLDQSGRKTRRSVCLPEGDEAAQLSSVEELKDGNNAIAEASLPFNPAASSSSTSIENESSPNIFVWCSPAIYFRIMRATDELRNIADEARNVAAAENCINRGALIDIRDKDHKTPLILAAKKNNRTLVKLYIRAGANLEARTKKFGHTALTIAVYYGHTTIVMLLLNARANVNVILNNGSTALIIAARYDYYFPIVVKLLLDAGAFKDAADQNGTTPLISAATHGCLENVELLISAGADTDAMGTFYGSEALVKASSHGHTKVARRLLQAGSHQDSADYDGKTALIWASRNGFIDIVEILLLAGANKGAMCKNGKTALYYAKCECRNLVIELLEQYA